MTGTNQIELIKAAVSARVRRFIPAEFEGPPELRVTGDPLDRGRLAARCLLDNLSRQIQSTIFVCGIFYERFQPGGLAGSRIGITSGLSGEGDYIANCRAMTAQAPIFDSHQQPNATICLTAANDVARFVCRILDLSRWPPEIRMRGLRIQVRELVTKMANLRGEYVPL